MLLEKLGETAGIVPFPDTRIFFSLWDGHHLTPMLVDTFIPLLRFSQSQREY